MYGFGTALWSALSRARLLNNNLGFSERFSQSGSEVVTASRAATFVFFRITASR
jgi:hypothetical protein